MADIATIWNSSGTNGDWSANGSDLDKGNDLVSAVLISLFTDRLANEDDVIPDGVDPRGWVGDFGQDVIIGSRLWLLNRRKITRALVPEAKGMAAESLQWLIDDGAVVKFDIEAEVQLPNRLNMMVTAYKKDGAKVAMRFTNSWKMTDVATSSTRMMVAPVVGGLVMIDTLEITPELEML